MTEKQRRRVSVVIIVIGGIVCLDGLATLGYTPGTFKVAAGCFLLAAIVGTNKLLRVVAMIFCAASIALAAQQANKRKEMAARVQRIRENAATSAFPKDANGDVLRRMIAAGDDLTKAREVEFNFVFEEEHKAKMFMRTIEVATSAMAEVRRDEDSAWSATVRTNFAPTHEKISSLEAMFTEAAKKFDGKADGWGTLQQRE